MDIIIAVILDWIIGDPNNFPHPIKLMGKIISFEEKIARKTAKNEKELYWTGFLVVLINIALVFALPFLILQLLKPFSAIYHIVNVYLIYTCISARCLNVEAIKIYKALDNGIEDARHKLSYIVGRDTSNLKEDEIIKATVETVAENTSDGIVAPLFYAVIGGAPLILVYKMVNTMDSMLGYLTKEYKYIGFFPAKIDDVFNYIPARVTGILMNLSAVYKFNMIRGFEVMWRDRNNHRSPNCAYPEGSVAGLLDIQLGGDHVYFGEIVKKPTIGDNTRQPERDDIKNTIEIMYRTEVLFMIIYILFVR